MSWGRAQLCGSSTSWVANPPVTNRPHKTPYVMINPMVSEAESTQAQVQKILQSKTFRTSEVHRNLLNYLAEKSLAGESDSLKEYTVGLDVFGKPASYDPRQESTVRMHVGRLRQKLAEYYRTEGSSDPIVVDLPKGGFRVTFDPRAASGIPEVSAEPVEPARRSYTMDIVLGAALLCSLLVAGYFGLRLWRVQQAAPHAEVPPELRELWGPMLSSQRPLMLCLATPTTTFPGVGAANGAFRLGQFLSKQNVVLTPTEQLSAPEIAMGNVVFLGPAVGNRQLQVIPVDFQVELEKEGVRNLHPKPGEETFLPDRTPTDPQDVEETYALISHVPGLYGDGEILYISGNDVSSVLGGVQALTDAGIGRTLVAKMKSPSGSLPRFYQIVLKVRAMDDMPIDVSYVLHRELNVSRARGPGR